MKKNIYILFLIPLFSFTIEYAQVYNDLNSSLKSGNYKTIVTYISNSIELNLPNNEGLFSKSQSEALLKDFFAKNSPKNYSIKHEGNSKDGSKFVIGSLETSNGTYRTYYFVKNSGNTSSLKELRIEKE